MHICTTKRGGVEEIQLHIQCDFIISWSLFFKQGMKDTCSYIWARYGVWFVHWKVWQMSYHCNCRAVCIVMGYITTIYRESIVFICIYIFILSIPLFQDYLESSSRIVTIIIGAVIASIVFVALFSMLVWWYCKTEHQQQQQQQLFRPASPTHQGE